MTTKKKGRVGTTIVTTWGSFYTQPTIDVEKIEKLQTSPYAKKLQMVQERLIFTGRPTYQVFDSLGDLDEDLTKELTTMLDAQNVSLVDKMPMAWRDIFWYGCSVFNPVWAWVGNRYVLTDLVRLAIDGFGIAPSALHPTYSSLLPGITIEDDEVAYYQVQDATDLQPVKLDSRFLYMIKDATEPSLTGCPMVVPVFGALSMLDFAWNAQMQKVNRIGAPVLFVKVTNGTDEDIALADKILKNWGRNTAFQLRENMEIVNLSVSDSEVALETVRELSKLVMEFSSPSLQSNNQSGITIGGSAWGENQMVLNYIEGVHRMMSSSFERMLQPWLNALNLPDYSIQIDLPSVSIDRADVQMKQAQTGFDTESLTLNEIRVKLEVPEADDALKAELEEYYSAKRPAPSPFPGIIDARRENEMSPPPGELDPDAPKADGENEESVQMMNEPSIPKQERTEKKRLENAIDDMASRIFEALREADK